MADVVLTVEQLREKCAEWQKILRLQDWDVQVSVDRAFNMKLREVSGECEWLLQAKRAHIRILHPDDHPRDTSLSEDMEQILVHELIHLHFAPFDKFEDGSLEQIAMEQAVDLIADSLVRLYRGG